MVITFSVPEARNQLLNEGEVYTFRWNRRKHIGKDWANSGRGTKKIANVYIEEMFEAEPRLALSPYVEKSGFKNLWDWQCIITNMMKDAYGTGWLYRVTLYPKR